MATEPEDLKDSAIREPVGEYKPTPEEEKLITLWTSRYKAAEEFRRPYLAKQLRMMKLYRAYVSRASAYNINLMPPIGFEVIETIKPRLAAARMRTRIFPRNKDDVGNPSLERWDDLVNYDFEVMELDDKKIDWIDISLICGNGYAHLSWVDKPEGGDPAMDILDNWLFLFDPNAGPRLKNSRWEIKEIFKKKKVLKKEEKKRGKGNRLYRNLKYVEDESISDDPRAERLELETLKMGQFGRHGTASEGEDDEGSGSDARTTEKSLRIWECYDHDEDKLIVIANKTVVIRNEENPYIDVNGGRTIVDLPCIKLPWSAYAMSVLEPIETTIYEIAEGRNQALENIAINLDPVRKIRKDSGLTADDIRYAPGAVWELTRAEDVVVESGPTLNSDWIKRDEVLRNEIQSTLALSEYVRGIPQSTGEPSSKVELLLMQTNIRFSQWVRQLETALTDVTNIVIGMNKEFLPEKKVYRLLGDDVDFQEFTDEDRDVSVDAQISLEIKPELTPEQRKQEALAIYKLFITDDPLPEGASPVQMAHRAQKKRAVQKMLIDAFDKNEYEDLLLDPLEDEDEEEVDEEEVLEEEMPEDLAESMAVPASPQIPQPIDPIPVEELGPVAPQGGGPIPGMKPSRGLLKRMLGRKRQAESITQ